MLSMRAVYIKIKVKESCRVPPFLGIQIQIQIQTINIPNEVLLFFVLVRSHVGTQSLHVSHGVLRRPDHSHLRVCVFWQRQSVGFPLPIAEEHTPRHRPTFQLFLLQFRFGFSGFFNSSLLYCFTVNTFSKF